jgi:hypothetical protein
MAKSQSVGPHKLLNGAACPCIFCSEVRKKSKLQSVGPVDVSFRADGKNFKLLGFPVVFDAEPKPAFSEWVFGHSLACDCDACAAYWNTLGIPLTASDVSELRRNIEREYPIEEIRRWFNVPSLESPPSRFTWFFAGYITALCLAIAAIVGVALCPN